MMYSTNAFQKPCNSVDRPPLRSVRLLDQVRERIRYRHYGIRTEDAYVYWVGWFVRFHGMRHPREMGMAEVTAFLVGDRPAKAGLRASEGAGSCARGVVGGGSDEPA